MTTALPEDDDLGPDSARVFLSYSRKDRERAQSIADVLREKHFGVYKDTDDILPTEEWKGRLEQLIAEADTIVFLMSPHSVASEVCAWEVEYATELNKRIAPIVIDDVEANDIPPLLARLNFIFATERDRFQDAVDSLVSALNSDIDWIREHTRLAGLARRWRENGRSARLLLRGQDIADAEQWRDTRPKEAPDVLSLHADFISASRSAAARRQRLVAGFSLAGLAVAVGLAAFALIQREAAVENEIRAIANEAVARENEKQAIEARAQAENARAAAETARQRAVEERNAAQISQSRMLAGNAQQALDANRPLDAALLALEALPDSRSADPGSRDRPLVDAPLVVLKQAQRNIREVAILHAGRGDHALALSGGGKLLAVKGKESGVLGIIDLASRTTVRAIRGREILNTHPPAFLPDGRHVVVPGSDGNLWFLETKADGKIHRLPVDGTPVSQVLPVSRGSHLAAVTGGKSLFLVPLNGGAPLRIADASAMAVSPDGSRIAALHHGTIAIHDATTGKRLHGPGPVFRDSLKPAEQLVFSPDGNWIAAVSEHLVWLLDGRTGEFVIKTGAREQSVMRVSFSPDSRLMTVSGADGRSPVYDLEARNLAARLAGSSGWQMETAIAEGNRIAASATSSGDVLVWDIANDVPLDTLHGHTSLVLRALLTPDGRNLITSSDDGTVRLWKMPGAAGSAESIVEEYRGKPVYSADGSLVALSEVGIFEVRTGKRIDSLPSDPFRGRYQRFLDDGRMIRLTGGNEIENLCVLPPPDYSGASCLFSEAQQNIWSADADGAGRTVVVHRVKEGQSFISSFDLASGEMIGELPLCPKDGEKGCYSDPRVSADGARILLTRWGVNVHAFDRTLSKPLFRIEPDYKVSSIHPIPGHDRLMIWGTSDKTARIHDSLNGNLVETFPLHLGSQEELTFSGDARYMATIKHDGSLGVHDLSANGELVLAVKATFNEGMAKPIFNKDGTLLLIGDGPRLLAFDLNTRARLETIPLAFGDVYPDIFAKGFADDDRAIIGWTWDGPQEFPLVRDPAEAIARVQDAAARCLSRDQRERNFLPPEPPRWCITGPGREQESDPGNWQPLWPYTGDQWRDWLAARDRGEEARMPGN